MNKMIKNIVILLALGFVAPTLFAQDKAAQTDAITIAQFPLKLALECDELEKAVDITATSTCEGKITITKKDVDASGGCVGTIMRTWTITDACGNVKTAEQYITKLDNQMPAIDEVEDMTIINFKDVTIPKAYDNCLGEVEVTYEDEYQNEGGKIVTLRTYTAVDGCGNTAVRRQKLMMDSPE